VAVLNSVLDAIGHTPVVRLGRVVPPNAATVLVKLEYVNPTGSYKDRMARAIIEGAEARGDLKPGMTVVEYTGGSTGSSLAFACAITGHPIQLVSSDAFSPEKLRTMAAFGAEVLIEPSEGGQITPDLFVRMANRTREIVAATGAYFTDQFNNPDALTGYGAIATELLAEVEAPIDAYCGGVGTGGMLVGVSRAFRAAGTSTRIVALEPASSPAMTKGHGGSHHIEGVGTGRVPPIVRDGDFDEARAIDEAEARAMAGRLAREEGIFAGTSTGMNVTGAIALARELGPGQTVVTVAVDFGLKYLAGDLFGPG